MNKRGMTLVEVICGIAILGVAMTFGFSIFVLAAQGYTRGVLLQTQINTVAQYFETGEYTASDGITVDPTQKETLNFNFGGKQVQLKDVPVTVVTAEDKSSKSRMKIYTNSIIGK